MRRREFGVGDIGGRGGIGGKGGIGGRGGRRGIGYRGGIGGRRRHEKRGDLRDSNRRIGNGQGSSKEGDVGDVGKVDDWSDGVQVGGGIVRGLR